MTKFLHGNYLDDEASYRKCEREWNTLFDRILIERRITDQWPQFWEHSTVHDEGMTWHGLGSILARVSPERKRAVLVFMAPISSEMRDSIDFANTGVDAFALNANWATGFTDGEVEFLRIRVALTVDTFAIVRKLFVKWVEPSTTLTDMNEFVQPAGARLNNFEFY